MRAYSSNVVLGVSPLCHLRKHSARKMEGFHKCWVDSSLYKTVETFIMMIQSNGTVNRIIYLGKIIEWPTWSCKHMHDKRWNARGLSDNGPKSRQTKFVDQNWTGGLTKAMAVYWVLSCHLRCPVMRQLDNHVTHYPKWWLRPNYHQPIFCSIIDECI